jgi:UDP-N-acetylglucosamine--N-acetylmuramyl-(pentapeptide) pyrophosphoryl-undecaprenol N-acetylglucosamine transferase
VSPDAARRRAGRVSRPAAVPAERAHAVISGGGTAGHVLPALAVAEALVDRGHPLADLHYVGAQRGIETRLVPPTGLPHTFLDVVGVQRRLDRSNLAFGPKLGRAIRDATVLLRTRRPRVVVSVGGYASLPAVLAARRLRIPIVVVSYDRRPGRASQLAARFAVASAVAFPGSGLPRARLTGAPLRRAVLEVDPARDRPAAREALDLPPERFVVLAAGGSLGSAVLNDAVRGFVALSEERGDLAVRHVVGKRFLTDEDATAAAGPARDGILYTVVGYEERMPLAYAAADLVVARAGASTVAELAAIGVPSILVPWPGAAADHQTDNARSLAAVGAAVLLPESQLTPGRLASEIEQLRADPSTLPAMAAAARAAGEIHHSGRLPLLIEEVAAGSGVR